MITGIYIGKEKIDLYEDENIRINSSIAKIEDITKIFTDKSNSFTVPASDNNNRIFKHWYNANIIGGYDARIKVAGLIELGGLDYKFGKFRLEKVTMKKGVASNYKITFFGNLVALKDLLEDDELSSLDLSAYDFTYNSQNVTARLGNQYTDVPFSLSSRQAYFYDSVNNLTSKYNIHYNGTNPENGFLWSDAIGSIKALKIIEAIESKYNIEFSRDFFGLNEFSNLFMLLSNDVDRVTRSGQIPLTTTDDPSVVGDVLLSGAVDDDTYNITFTVTPASSDSYTVQVKEGEDVIYSSTQIGTLLNKRISNPSNRKNLTFHVSSTANLSYSFNVIRYRTTGGSPATENFSTSSSSFIPAADFIVSDRLPKMKTIDFLSGLFSTYKLIAEVNTDGTVYVDSIANYYRKGKVWTGIEKYIDYDSFDVERGVLNNEITYAFEDATTIAGITFKESEGVEYGNLEHKVLDDNEKLIDGTDLDFSVPFETAVYTKYNDQAGVDNISLQSLFMYGQNNSSTDMKPHIHFLNTEPLNGTFKFINDNGTAQEFTQPKNMMSHTLGFTAPISSTVFGEEFNEWDGSLITNTIYSNHHKPYIENVFNKQKRSFTFIAKNVPLELLNKIRLNDVLEIKEEYYRIDSYDINITKNEIVFKLINAINLDLTPIYSMSLDRIDITLDNIEVTLDQI